MTKILNPRTNDLSYIAMRSPDVSQARDYYTNVLGLVETTGTAADASYFSVGGNHHDVIVEENKNTACAALGFRLVEGTSLEEFARDIEDFGLKSEIRTDARPDIPGLVRVEAPGGNIMEFHAEGNDAAAGFTHKGVSPVRLGHVAIISPEATRLQKFYQEFLGFHYTDDFDGIATFLTCNHDHHVVNLVNAPESRVHHIAFELVDNAHHPRACDVLAHAKIDTLWGPARHTAGHNLAGYHRDPDGTLIELYTEMDIYVPGSGRFEPRPWHEHQPMRPMSRSVTAMTLWETEYVFDLVTA